MNSELKKREAYLAGKFYPETRKDLTELLDRILEKEKEKIEFDAGEKQIIGGILPHAGHVYSGYQTVHFFEALKKSAQDFDSFLILHPFHRGGYEDYATDQNDYWSTPLGDIALDRKFIDHSKIPSSSHSHRWEHSAEVIIPFIQYFGFSDKKIIPVGIAWQHPESSMDIAHKIFSTQKKLKRKICILASSDFSHFVSPEEGNRKDNKAIDKILDFEPEELYKVIVKDNISICGYGPIMTLLYYAGFFDQKINAEILSRGHSGQVSPGKDVVDYVSMIFYI
ncbi:MAG: AmmeMemoRadiSam system protein B [Bacteroidota bacterium]